MNALTQQFSTAVFNCEFCKYQSKLDLRECPECGRVKKSAKISTRQSAESEKIQTQTAANVPFGTPYFCEPSAASYIFECANCRYQSRNAFLHECPECGRLKFEKKPASKETKTGNDFEENAGEEIPGASHYALKFGGIFLLTAFELFMGVQLSDFGGDYEKTAEIGENFTLACVAAIPGIVFVLIGLHMKIKEYTE